MAAAFVAAVALVAALVVAGRVTGVAAAVDGETVQRSGEHVVVAPGETVTSIARGLVPAPEVAQYVERIVALNGHDRAVSPGQVLALPSHG